jgi:twitching motility protein PilT
MRPEYDQTLSELVGELNSHQNKTVPPADSRRTPVDLAQLLTVARDRSASDILLVAGAPAAMRCDGHLTFVGRELLPPEEIQRLVLPLLSHSEAEKLQQEKTVDLAFDGDGTLRFRANLHYQRGTLAASIRLLPLEIPKLESLNLPATIARIADFRQGLVLLTGPTGCGKSSTLAALVDRINRQRRCHIITIEEPVEFVHRNCLSVVEQIEVGRDTPSFLTTLRSILRQSPDVILIGEMRDPETIATALTAAETGHLVLSTLHTNDTSQAISRILDSFPAANEPQIRQQLSLALAAVVAQQLVPAVAGKGRLPALEILFASDAVRSLIRKGQDHQIRSQLVIGRAAGMITMEQSLADLVRHGKIDREVALSHCFRSDDLQSYLQG